MEVKSCKGVLWICDEERRIVKWLCCVGNRVVGLGGEMVKRCGRWGVWVGW